MRLYDTASRTVRPFQPHEGVVRLYVCGITPYDAAHLGHAFTFHVFDVITRRLRSLGNEVRSVRNVTDVDDDMLRVARERGVDFRRLAEDQVRRFDTDMAALGLLPVAAPRATEQVPAMIELVDRLHRGGFAYEVDGWVFFDTGRFPAFGRLCRLDAAEMRELSARRGADPGDPRKRHPLDFVLWQRSLPDEPSWTSPWGAGRPGWHLECSVLSTAALGSPIDIHGGGDDLIFPHHECEIAQSEAAGVVPFVRHWVHVSHVAYGGEKMSKSLGNLVFTRDLLAEVAPATVRLLLSDHHHRAGWSYDAAGLEAAERRRRAYEAAAAPGMALTAGQAAEVTATFLERLDDDLDTPGALRAADRAAALAEPSGSPSAAGDRLPAGEVLRPLLDHLGVMDRQPTTTRP